MGELIEDKLGYIPHEWEDHGILDREEWETWRSVRGLVDASSVYYNCDAESQRAAEIAQGHYPRPKKMFLRDLECAAAGIGVTSGIELYSLPGRPDVLVMVAYHREPGAEVFDLKYHVFVEKT